MLKVRESPFVRLHSDLLEADLFETLERQLNNADRQRNARLPATKAHDGPDAYMINLEWSATRQAHRSRKPGVTLLN